MIIVPAPGQSRAEFFVVVKRQLAAFWHMPEQNPPSKEDVALHIAHGRRTADLFSRGGRKPAGLDELAGRLLHDLRASRPVDRPGDGTAPDDAAAPATGGAAPVRTAAAAATTVSRPAYERALAAAIARAATLREAHAQDGRIDVALQQLRAIGGWTADGGIPVRKDVEGLPIFTVVTMLVDPVWPMVDGAADLAESLLEVWIHALGAARAD